jgi:hypothetical protein
VLSSAACAGGSLTIPVALDCSGRIPPGLREDTPHASFPKDNTVGEIARFGDEEAGQLDRSNDSKRTALWIVDRCEQEEREAMKRIDNRPFLLKLLRPTKPG